MDDETFALKKKLDELLKKKRLIRQKQAMIAEEQTMIDGVSSIRYDEPAVLGGVSVPQAEKYAEHMERLKADLENALEEVFAIEDFISEHLKDLSPIEQNILIDRYMSGKSWRKIQQEYHYEHAQPYRIVNSAVKKLSESVKHDMK